MSKYLITGGAGFIGSNIAEALIRNGDSVCILDNFSCGKLENLSFASSLPKERFEIIRGDISNPADCDRACNGVDYVLHQAGLKSVPKSLKDPLSYNNVNINGILFLLQASLKNNVKRFVFASSSSVYGNTDQFPQKEEHLPAPISPYALSKLAGENYCRIFTNCYGLETVALRYFNVFGPKQALDDEYSAVIPKFIKCIFNNEQPPIYGNGKQSRDFTYIDNVVSANIAAATTAGIKHEIFNAAVGKEYSVLQLVSGINKILGKSIEPKFLEPRVGDIFKSNSDSSKLQRLTAYRPTVSFDEGLKLTVEYFKSK